MDCNEMPHNTKIENQTRARVIANFGEEANVAFLEDAQCSSAIGDIHGNDE